MQLFTNLIMKKIILNIIHIFHIYIIVINNTFKKLTDHSVI